MRKLAVISFAILCSSAMEAQPVIGGISNAFSAQVAFSPGELVSVYGTNMVAGTAVPTVSVGGKAAYVSPQSVAAQLTVQLPVDLATGPTTLTVTAGGQTSAPFSLTIAAYAPALLPTGGIGYFTDSNGKQITATNQATPGETIVGVADGLGALNPAIATGVAAPAASPTAATVTATVGGATATVVFAGAVKGGIGVYQVNITIPTTANGCGTAVVLTVGGISSPPVAVPISTTTPVLCAVENSATGLVKDATHGAAAGSFISLYTTGAVSANSATNIFPATDYQGVEADFNGTAVPIYLVYNLPPSQLLINTALPPNAASSGTGVITVKTSSGTSQSYTIELAPTDVGVFRLPDPNTGAGDQGVVLLANSYWFTMPAALVASYDLPACTGLPVTTPCGQPAAPNDSIVIYFTGGGLATPKGDPNGTPLAIGTTAPLDGSVVYQTVVSPTIMIGGFPATVGFSGIAPGTASEYQINTTIPAGVQTSDAVPVVITMGGSSDTITIAVKAQ